MKKLNKQKALEKTRKKVSKDWQTYREKKQKILNRRLNSSTKVKLIGELKQKTLDTISGDYSHYRITLYNSDTKKPLVKTKEYKLKTGFEQHYRVRRPYNSNAFKSLQRAKVDKDVRYVLVTIELFMNDDDRTVYISQTFTKIALERVDKNIVDEIINSFILKSSTTSSINNNYMIKNIFIRMIYESSKTNIKTKQLRKYRKAKA